MKLETKNFNHFGFNTNKTFRVKIENISVDFKQNKLLTFPR